MRIQPIFRVVACFGACVGAGMGLAGCTMSEAPGEMDIIFDACEPLVVEVAPGASEAQLASIEEGIAMWNELAGTQITTRPFPQASRLPLWFEEAAPVFYGVYLHETGEIVLNEGMDDRQAIAVTVAHELGHAFGMWHVKGRTSVMNSGNRSVGPTAEDVAHLDELWGPCPEEWTASPDVR